MLHSFAVNCRRQSFYHDNVFMWWTVLAKQCETKQLTDHKIWGWNLLDFSGYDSTTSLCKSLLSKDFLKGDGQQ